MAPSVELDLPPDFPAGTYEAVRSIVCTRARQGELVEEFDAAWTGMAFRFLALARDGDDFTASLQRAGRHPPPRELYEQEEALFGFVTNAVATLESYCYALFAIGAMIRPESFVLATPTDRRNATVGATMRGYSVEFGGEELTRALFWWLNSREFGWWKEARTILAQRIIPLRSPASDRRPAYGLTHGEWSLRGEKVDAQLTTERRAWVAGALRKLIGETEAFVGRNVIRDS